MSDAVEYIGARLSLLADWLDSKFGDAGKNDEVQRDLRRWARQFIEQPVTSELAARDERITELTAEVERLKVELRRLTQNVESSVKACHPPISRHYFVTEATKDDIERIRTLLDPPPIASQPTAAELAAEIQRVQRFAPAIGEAVKFASVDFINGWASLLELARRVKP